MNKYFFMWCAILLSALLENTRSAESIFVTFVMRLYMINMHFVRFKYKSIHNKYKSIYNAAYLGW